MSEAHVLSFPSPLDQWKDEGLRLGERERSARSLMWDIGDWWNAGEDYGERAQVVSAGDWKGPAFQTCMNAAVVCRAFKETYRRREVLSFEHHAEVAALPPATADALLDWCLESDEPRTRQELRTRKQQIRRAEREQELAGKIADVAYAVGHAVYGVIYADPPWRLEPYSRDTGLNRAADNHYPTMTREALLDMEVMHSAPAKDCVLFCWATAPMLQEALEWMAHYGFEYRSHCVWIKDRIGTGFWFRNQHELLLVGVRGDVPAPAPGTQFASVIQAPLGEHSAKPPAFAEMIEEMFPSQRLLEMFARGPRLGWDTWGNEA